jgi:hypothetical protein
VSFHEEKYNSLEKLLSSATSILPHEFKEDLFIFLPQADWVACSLNAKQAAEEDPVPELRCEPERGLEKAELLKKFLIEPWSALLF